MQEHIEVQRHRRENIRSGIFVQYLRKLDELLRESNVIGRMKEEMDDDIKL